MHSKLAVAIAAALFIPVAAFAGGAIKAPKPEPKLALTALGTYESGFFNEGGAEITAFDPLTRRAFVINAGNGSLDVLDLRNPTAPQLVSSIDFGTLGHPNSVDVKLGMFAVALEAADDKTQPGQVAVYSTFTLKRLFVAPVGALPDMVTFSDDARYIVVANEGEPNDEYTIDPEGSVSVIDLLRIGRKDFVRTADFRKFDAPAERAKLIAKGVRLYAPNASTSQDIEPEYITIKGSKAFVTLQEANAIAIVNLVTAKVDDILALGLKNHAVAGNEIDPSDRDSAIAIGNWPIYGMYQPDAIDSFNVGGKNYLITANEGDTRAWEGYNEEVRVSSNGYVLDPTLFPGAAQLKANTALGRLTVTNASGDIDGDGDFDRIQVFGGRSFSIWSEQGQLVYDSGSLLERIVAETRPQYFNAGHDDNTFDSRSDNKGPEPEMVVVGEVDGRPYAFVGLERISGIAVFDLSNPKAPRFVTYADRRDFTQPASIDVNGEDKPNPLAGDLGPEGIEFVPAWASPTRKPLLIVGNEVSGTTTVWQVALSK